MTRAEKLRHLRHLTGVFENGHAPEGWAEIERFDSLDTGPENLRPLESDEEAAILVAEAGGMPGTAMLLHVATGAFVRVEDVELDADAWRGLREAVETLEPDSSAPTWVCVVPERAAREAGL